MIRAAYASPCNLAVVALQDLLGLGSEARFNTPGTVSGNWGWRCRAEQLDRLAAESSTYLREIAWLFNRKPSREQYP